MNKKKNDKWEIFFQNVDSITKYATKTMSSIREHAKESKTIMFNIVEIQIFSHT